MTEKDQEVLFYIIYQKDMRIMAEKKTQYITLLNVISCIAVVFLHTNGCFWTFSKDKYWITADIIESICYFAVPVFFMIPGATLIDYSKRYTTMQYIRKRVDKTLIPYLGWNTFGILYCLAKHQLSINQIGIKYLVNGYLGGTIIKIYWFFPAIFGIYMCIPVLEAIEESKKKVIFLYLAIGGFVLNLLIPFLKDNICPDVTWPYTIGIVSGYLLYPIVGYLISHFEIKRRWCILIYISSVIGFLLHCVGTYILSVKAETVVQVFKGYMGLPCFLYSVGIFLFCKQYGNVIMEFKIGKYIKKFASYTMGIYLVHFFVMDFVRQTIFFKLLNINDTSLKYRIVGAVLVIMISVVIVGILRKIPFVKRFIP